MTFIYLYVKISTDNVHRHIIQIFKYIFISSNINILILTLRFNTSNKSNVMVVSNKIFKLLTTLVATIGIQMNRSQMFIITTNI
jgi:hypothetical protein